MNDLSTAINRGGGGLKENPPCTPLKDNKELLYSPYPYPYLSRARTRPRKERRRQMVRVRVRVSLTLVRVRVRNA